jgi:glycosyltransferase involved in cell wall biosynthesis
MKILVLTPRFPFPLIGGDKIRIYHIVKALKEANHNLTLLSFIEKPKEAPLAREKELIDIFSSIHTVLLPKWRSYLNAFWGLITGKPLQTSYYHSKKMQSLVDKELSLGDYNAVLVHLIRMAPYVIGRSDIYKVLEMTDALSLNYRRSREQGSKGFLGKVYATEEKRARDYERECVKKFDTTVVVSNVDKSYLIGEASGELQKKVRVAPHGSQDVFFQKITNNYEPNLIVFIGNLRTHQNNDAILYFIKDIYPLIKQQAPNVKLRIVGDNPSWKVRAFQGKEDIEITGRVENVADYVKDAAVSVSPIRIGAGMRGKILESMAIGAPVVTTSLALEGIEGGTAAEHFLVADEPKAFAAAVLELINNKSKRRALVEKAQKLAERYRYSKLAADYAKLFI